ncbi:MAG: hypothetical protein DIU60_015665 [Actinomycetes bacterium]
MKPRVSTAPELHVREHRLPGGRHLFTVTLADGTLVSVAADPAAGTRELAITPPRSDAATARATFRDPEAAVVAAILSGMRFVVEGYEEYGEQPVRALNLRTVTIGPSSPAVGRRLPEIEVPDPEEAEVIGVIHEDEPGLIRRDPGRACRPGDRLVIVGRPGAMSRIVAHLLG